MILAEAVEIFADKTLAFFFHVRLKFRAEDISMHKIKRAAVISMLLFAAMGVFHSSAKSQNLNDNCVQCRAHASGFFYVASSAGGGASRTQDYQCYLTGPCGVERDAPGNAGCDVKTIKQPLVQITNEQVRAIAAFDPRLAIAAISVRKTYFDVHEMRMMFTSVEYSASDVESHLSTPLESSYRTELEKRVIAARSEDQTILEFRAEITSAAKGGKTLVIRPINGGGNSVEFQLEPANESRYRAASFAVR